MRKCSEQTLETVQGAAGYVCCEHAALEGMAHCLLHTKARLALTRQRLTATFLSMQHRVGTIVGVELQLAVLERQQAKDRADYLSDYQLAQELAGAVQEEPDVDPLSTEPVIAPFAASSRKKGRA